MATRSDLVTAIATAGGVTTAEAEAVLDYYVREIRVAKKNAHDGYQLKDGAFLDRDVIQRAATILADREARALVKRQGLERALGTAAAAEQDAVRRSPHPKWESEHGHHARVRRAVEDIARYDDHAVTA